MRNQKISIRTDQSDGGAIILVHCESHEITYNTESETYKFTFVNGLLEGEGEPHLLEKLVVGKRAFVFLAATTPEPQLDDAAIQALADEAEAGYDPNKLIPRRTPGTENLVISRDNQ